MSTETTNKKIKIDNGTTFGRTYTDKAVDELLNSVGGGGISVIELTDKNGTIASTQLGEINANPQNFSFKYNGKILSFTSADSTTYQYCNNTTSSSENNVMTTSTLLTITSSTGAYTIAENVHNVVANSIHPANGGDLTNIQVGSKVYSIPSGGGSTIRIEYIADSFKWTPPSSDKTYNFGDYELSDYKTLDENELPLQLQNTSVKKIGTATFILMPVELEFNTTMVQAIRLVCINPGTIPANTRISTFVFRVKLVSE